MPRLNANDTRATHRSRCARLLGAAVTAGCLAAPAGAQQPPATAQPPTLTLAGALREVAARSTAAVTSALDVDAARTGTARAEAAYRPSVSVSAGYELRDHEIVARFGTLAAPSTESNFFTGEIDATQLLWDGGRRASALASSRALEHAAAAQGEASVFVSQIEGLQTYIRVLVLKAQRHVLAQRVASLQAHLREVQDLFDQGVVARNDLLATEVRLRVVDDQVSQVNDGEAVALQGLNRVLGRNPTDPLALPQSLPSPPPLGIGVAELKRRAADANRQLLALRARLKAQEDVVALRRADSAPTVFAQASHTYQQDKYLVYPNANVLFLGLSWQAYDGGVRKAGVNEAEFTAARTRQEIADLQRRLEVEVEQAFREYEQALRQAATAETNVKAAVENLRIEEDQYKAGLVRTTEVLDAESLLAESRFALVNQHYDAYLTQGAVLAVAGEDLPTFFAAVGSAGQEQ
jgi:outer membrane protein